VVSPILDQKMAYRRGLVLGFTMAEVTIMVLFCLLLASAFLIDEKEKQLSAAQQELSDVSEASKMVEAFKSKYGERSKIEDIFTELKLVRQSNEQLVRKTTEQEAVLAAVAKDAELTEGVKKSLHAAGISDISPSGVTALVRAGLVKGDKAVQCERDAIEKNRLEGQLANAQATLTRLGKGTEMPACWANPQSGRPEYIFTVDLTSTGLIIRNQKLPHREAEQSLLPLDLIAFDVEVAPDVFRAQTDPLWSWSKDHQCRFFVMVRDRTQATEKDTYKRMLHTLEEHFYKLEVG
jgi:hypothetical protein